MVKVIFKIILVIVLAFIPSLGVDYFYRHAYQLPYYLPQNIFFMPSISNKYTLVKVGNSHAQDGLLFTKYNVKSLDLSNVSQSFEFDLAMLKMYSRQIDDNAIVIINVSPISFSQDTPKKEDYVNMNYYDGRLSPFLIPRIKLSEYLQIQIFPFVRAGYLWRTRFAQDQQQKAIASYALLWTKPAPPPPSPPSTPPTPTPTPSDTPVPLSLDQIHAAGPIFHVSDIKNTLNQPPDPSDQRLLDSRNFMANKWYNSGGFSTASFSDNKKMLQEMIDYTLAHHWRPVLISLPISQILVDDLEKGYMNKYLYNNLTGVNTHGVPYFDFASNPQLTEDRYLYSNSDHLNGKGASIVSYLLLQKLIHIGYLPKSADGYDYK